MLNYVNKNVTILYALMSYEDLKESHNTCTWIFIMYYCSNLLVFEL